MKIAERIILVALLLVLLGGGAWIYFSVQYDHQQTLEAVARGDFEIREEEAPEIALEDWRVIYPDTVPARIGSTSLEVSVADNLNERIAGLSNTPFLPEHVVKLFVFGSAGNHSIWMKDMNYSLDILWLDEEGLVVHIEEDVSPDTFPQSFASPVPAWFVVEANAGFVATNQISLGDDFVVLSE
jgi:uncharacterized membrane protein (UPF0127 family)